MLKPVKGLTWTLALPVSHRSQIELMLINSTMLYFVHEHPLIHVMLAGFAPSGVDLKPSVLTRENKVLV